MPRILVVGHSHIFAIHDAFARSPSAQDLFKGIDVDVVSIRDAEFRPEIRNGALNRNIRSIVASCGEGDLVFSCVGGNAHNALGLVNSEPRFDFYLPGEEGTIDTSAELLPLGLVRTALSRLAGKHVQLLSLLAGTVGARMFHLESPPPVPSAAHFENHRGVFRDRIARYGVAPIALRYKLWTLHSQLFRAACAACNAVYVAVPPETQDASGALASSFWNSDGVHGNIRYGEAVLRQIRAIYDRAQGKG